MVNQFKRVNLKELYRSPKNSSGEDNGQVTIIGGSRLFHGAPILALKVASRIVDMVFFATEEKSVGYVAENIKSKLMSFIWIPWEEVEAYVEKSDAVLIGPGMMRYASEWQKGVSDSGGDLDSQGEKTREITKRLLTKFPEKKWVIDAGSLQVMEAAWIPKGAVLTPNIKEFEILFGHKVVASQEKLIRLLAEAAQKYECTLVLKRSTSIVTNGRITYLVSGGNPGLTKGGTGDVLAGLTVALLAKNDSLLAASAASFIEKKTAEFLFQKVGLNFSADDLAQTIPQVWHQLTSDN